MIVRTPERLADVSGRFVLPHEGFEVRADSPLFEARVVAAAPRAVELFREMLGHLSPDVGMSVEDWRSGGRWCGNAVSRESIRRELDASAVELARTAGAEIAVFDDEDQVTLTANLDLWLQGRTARWYHLLRGCGLRPIPSLPVRSWRLRRGEFPAAPEATASLASLAERLGLGAGT